MIGSILQATRARSQQSRRIRDIRKLIPNYERARSQLVSSLTKNMASENNIQIWILFL